MYIIHLPPVHSPALPEVPEGSAGEAPISSGAVLSFPTKPAPTPSLSTSPCFTKN